ncbi:hypothetical protein MNB_SUP05-5-909 [hydrothermal vent metagenome]|uniref:Uncharacterized protein n=1 Tax=hydrothermal vent metagenome TaxID=652676 RepID=A0A1W1CL26_9ZZZZ
MFVIRFSQSFSLVTSVLDIKTSLPFSCINFAKSESLSSLLAAITILQLNLEYARANS